MKAQIKRLYQFLPFKKELFIVLKQFWIPSFYKRLHFKGPFRISVGENHSFAMHHHNRYGLETEYFWHGLQGWESASIEVWAKLCAEAKVILDIGANEGIYSLLSKCLSPRALVIAFEPLPSAFAMLKANVTLNNYDIECEERAVSDFDGKGALFSSSEEYSTEATLDRSSINVYGLQSWQVDIVKLSTVIESLHLEHIDLIKIDVERAEPGVLKGMGEYLSRFRPSILIEVLNDQIGKEIEDIVRGLNYVYFDINDDSRNGPKDIKKVSRICKARCLNYLLLTPEKALEVGLMK